MKLASRLSTLVFASILGAQVHVSPLGNDGNSGSAGSPFRTINHAASVASNGGTIFVHAGTYGDEQGIVQLGTKDLVLQGDGAATTILHGHSSLTILLPVVEPGGGSSLHRVVVLINGTARVDLRDLTIDGERVVPPSGYLAGLYLRGGAGCLLERVTVTGCRPAVWAAGTALGVALHGDQPTDPTTLMARASTVRDCGTAGVRARLRAELDLQECAFAGNLGEASVIDQCGVLVESSAIAIVRHCQCHGFGGSAGAALRLDGQDPGCALEGNRIGRSAFGIDVRQFPAAVVPGSVRNNRVANVDTALRVRGNSGLQITGNTLHTYSARDPLEQSDDTAGANLWQGNRYAVLPGTTSVAIPSGGNVDNAPKAGISELPLPDRVACGGGPVSVVVADFDGDGRQDFATLDYTTTGTGISVGLWRPSGWLVSSISFGGSGLRPVALVADTYDASAGVDLVALTAPLPPVTSGATFWVFHNDGAGAMSLLHQENLPGMVMPTAIATGHFNLNPFGHLVVVDQGAPPFTPGSGRTLLNDGTGTLWFTTALPATFTAPLVAAATGDIDGDNKVDIAVTEGSPSSGRVHLFLGNGIGFFSPHASSPFTTPVNPSGVAIADLDADGDRDLLVAATAGTLPLQRGALLVVENQAGVLQPQPVQPTDLGPTRILTADLDGDTFLGILRPELVVLDLAAGNIALHGARRQGLGFAGGGLCTAVDGPVDIAIINADGDDFRDVIAAEPQRGGVAILHGVPTARVESFGRGCPGAFGREPRLETRGVPGVPVQPNLSLQIGLTDGAPLSLVIIAASLAPAPVLVPCSVQLATIDATFVAVTDVQGKAAINMAIPATPELRGLPLCFQAGVYDPAATTSIFPGFSLTSGYRIRVGD